ncbi:MAG: hypothetical protein KJ574_05405 [Nanoarchaeota archaeon]|nr:hypothetical protein [Nanoarchaeota archaeon]
MRAFRSKKGLQQADWAISVGIFVVYLVVFFIAIKPLITPPSKIDSLLSGLEDRFTENTTVTVDRVPILVREATDYDYEPIIVDIPYSWNSSNMAVSEGYFVFDSGKLLFFANTSEKLDYSVSHSSDVHDQISELNLVSSVEQATVSDFKVEFSDGMPLRYTYKGAFRIESLYFYLDGEAFEKADSYTDDVSIAKYLGAGNVNHTTYVFAENPRTYSYITPTDNQPHNFTIALTLYNYTEYYAGISSQGDINYATENCKEMETDFIDLTDGSTGLAFFFNNETEIELCSNETELTMSVSQEIGEAEEASYLIFLHRGDHTDIDMYPVDPILGFKQLISSTSYNAISSLAAMDYADLKARWAFPKDNDFRIVLTSEYYNETIGPNPPLVDVYAKQLLLYNFDGIDFEEATIVLTVWGGS